MFKFEISSFTLYSLNHHKANSNKNKQTTNKIIKKNNDFITNQEYDDI